MTLTLSRIKEFKVNLQRITLDTEGTEESLGDPKVFCREIIQLLKQKKGRVFLLRLLFVDDKVVTFEMHRDGWNIRNNHGLYVLLPMELNFNYTVRALEEIIFGG